MFANWMCIHWRDLYTGVVSTLAGSGMAGYVEGLGTSASFSEPRGVSVDSNGAIYVADNTNHRIRKVLSSGVYGGHYNPPVVVGTVHCC